MQHVESLCSGVSNSKSIENMLSGVDCVLCLPQEIPIYGSKVVRGLQFFVLVKWNRNWSLEMSSKVPKA